MGTEVGFRIEPPHGADAPIVAHVPHGSTVIPPDVRASILLDDASLADELVRLTDWHTDDLYAWTARLGATRFINERSRLVVDPERFADDADEPMARVGRGAVYVRTTDGRVLRDPTPTQRDELLERFFHPYHRALTALVGATLDRFGQPATRVETPLGGPRPGDRDGVLQPGTSVTAPALVRADRTDHHGHVLTPRAPSVLTARHRRSS